MGEEAIETRVNEDLPPEYAVDTDGSKVNMDNLRRDMRELVRMVKERSEKEGKNGGYGYHNSYAAYPIKDGVW